MTSKIETIQNPQPTPDEALPWQDEDLEAEEARKARTQDIVFAQDMIQTDYDKALADVEHTDEVNDDEVHEKPNITFHNGNLHNQPERHDGARADEATEIPYEEDASEARLLQEQALAHIVAESELEIDPPLDDPNDLASQWLAEIGEVHKDPATRRATSAEWLKEKRQ